MRLSYGLLDLNFDGFGVYFYGSGALVIVALCALYWRHTKPGRVILNILGGVLTVLFFLALVCFLIWAVALAGGFIHT